MLIATGGGALACVLALIALGDAWHRGLIVRALAVGAGFVVAGGIGYLGMKLLRVEELGVIEGLAGSLASRLLRRPR